MNLKAADVIPLVLKEFINEKAGRPAHRRAGL